MLILLFRILILNSPFTLHYLPAMTLTFIFLFLLKIPNSYCSKSENRLFNDLMKNYHPSQLERPVANASEKLTVYIGVDLQQIINMVSKYCRGSRIAPFALGLLSNSYSR